MYSYDYEAVVYEGEVFCNECCPVSLLDLTVTPIFADSEWKYYPVCVNCDKEHTYVNIIE